MNERMDCLPPVLYLALLLESALTFLPAPVNVSVSSVNFLHVLRWDPGPGTPPGTRYKIIRRVNGKEPKKLPYSMTTSFKLKLHRPSVEYVLTVQASHNQTLSPESRKVRFIPFTQTKLGPPKVSLAGCGNCIRINMSLPEAAKESGIDDIKTVYPGAQFRIYWRKHHENAVDSDITPNQSYIIYNLQTGAEYCVQVHTKINVNRNTEPSAWNCTFTSTGPSRDDYFSGKLAAVLIVVFIVLMSSTFCLHYTGYLCKLATLPRVLIEALNQGYTLTPERIIPDHISINAEMEHSNPTAPAPATREANSEEEDEEEEEGNNLYVDRGAELTSGENSCQDSVDVSENSKSAAPEGSGSYTVEVKVPGTEFEGEVRHEGLDPEEDSPERAEGSVRPEGLEEEEEEEVEEACGSSGNINLFSVTLAALAVSEEVEEEEQNVKDSLTDLLNMEPLLATDSRRTYDDHTVMLPSQEDCTASGYEGRRANELSGCLKTYDNETQHEETQEEEEEEEEEGFSGYMRHT